MNKPALKTQNGKQFQGMESNRRISRLNRLSLLLRLYGSSSRLSPHTLPLHPDGAQDAQTAQNQAQLKRLDNRRIIRDQHLGQPLRVHHMPQVRRARVHDIVRVEVGDVEGSEVLDQVGREQILRYAYEYRSAEDLDE